MPEARKPDRLPFDAWIDMLNVAAADVTTLSRADAVMAYLGASLATTSAEQWIGFGNGWGNVDPDALRSAAAAAVKSLPRDRLGREVADAAELLSKLVCDGHEGRLVRALQANAERFAESTSVFGRRSAAGEARSEVIGRVVTWITCACKSKLALDAAALRSLLGSMVDIGRFHGHHPLEPLEYPIRTLLKICVKQEHSALAPNADLLEPLAAALAQVPVTDQAGVRERAQWLVLVDEIRDLTT